MIIVAQWKFEISSWLRNGEQALLNFVVPAITLAFSYFQSTSLQNTVIELTFITANAASAFTGLSIVMAFDRRYGILKFYATSPLGLRDFYVAKVLVALTISLIQSFAIYAIARLLQLSTPPLYLTLLTLALLTPFWVALAFLFASALSAENVLAAANGLFVLLVVTAIPLKISTVFSFINPMSWGVDLLNAQYFTLFIISVATCTAVFFAKRAFRWID